MPDYDYRVDTSLCQAVNAVTATTGSPRSLVLEMVQRVNTTTEKDLHALECYDRLTVGPLIFDDT